MNTPSNSAAGSPLESQVVASQVSAPTAATRPLYWSIRRELWENRSIYVAPLAAAGLGMLAFFINLLFLPRTIRGESLPHHAAMPATAMLAMPYGHLAWLLLPTAFLVGVFYSLDALHGERRDRSILFWKSLPVSDLTAVLAKISIPLVVLPLLVFALFLIFQAIMLLLSTFVLLVSGAGAGPLLTQLPFFQMQWVLLYSLVVVALWHAPIYAWLLLVSGWAKRATFLWAFLPLLAIGAFERIAFHTSHFGSLLEDRLFGFAPQAFAFKMPTGETIDPHFIPLTQLTPGKFLGTPGLWVGLIFAAVFIAAAVRLRRYREPI